MDNNKEKQMTKTWKDRLWSWTSNSVLTIILALATISFASKKDDDKDLRKEVQQISIKKADIEYVDKKCLDIKAEIKDDQEDIKTNLRDLNGKTDRILEIIIEQKK